MDIRNRFAIVNSQLTIDNDPLPIVNNVRPIVNLRRQCPLSIEVRLTLRQRYAEATTSMSIVNWPPIRNGQ